MGLSDRDCDCFSDGRPDTATTASQNRLTWTFQKFTAPDSPPDPYALTVTYDLPTGAAQEAGIQLFSGGQLLTLDTDFSVSGAKEITVTTPVPGQVYQIYYLASVPETVSIPAYTESDSGLYLTDLLPEEEVAALAGCDKTLWDMYQKAREIAIKEFKAALNTTIARRYQPKLPAFRGSIGETTGDYLTAATDYAGVRIRTNGMRSGYLKITRIMALFQATGSVTVTIYDRSGTVVVPAFSIATSAGGKAITTVDINLPLLGDFQSQQDYFLVYEYDAANKPRQNKIACACNRNFSPTLSASAFTPLGYDAHDRRRGQPRHTGGQAWHNYIMLGGWTGDSVSDFSDAPDTVTQYLNGLVLDIEIGCDMTAGLCGMVESFGANEYAMSAAMAIQRRAAAWLVNRRYSSSLPNRANAVNRDELLAQARKWEAEYAEIVSYLSANIPESAHDCYECVPRVRTGSILS